MRIRKMPLNARTGKGAKSNDPKTWAAFDVALAAAEARADWGVGYMFDGETFGVDIDHCIDRETGEISPLAADVLSIMDTYAEFSPSGEGIHLLCKGKPPEAGRKIPKLGLEVYGQTRFFTVTGRPLGEARALADGTEAAKCLFAKYITPKDDFASGKAAPTPPTVDASTGQTTTPSEALSDADILRIASRSKDGATFDALYFRGDTSAFQGDHSAADVCLCNKLAFYTGKDERRMDELFRRSALYREKWDERRGALTYGERTIREACESTHTVFEPRDRTAAQDFRAFQKSSPFARFETLYAASTGGRYVCKNGKTLFVSGKTADDNGEVKCEPLAHFACAPVEEIRRDDGVEARLEFVLEGINSRGEALPRICVPATKFKAMTWITEQWGGQAVLVAGQAKADKLREAVQLVGQHSATRRTVYTHTGWRKIGGKWAYLYHGGAVGAEGVSVELEVPLARLALPPVDASLADCMAASRALLDLAPLRVTAPVLATAYLAPLCTAFEAAGHPVAHVLFLGGHTGAMKSTLAALCMAHFGRSFTASTPTANFHDTANSARYKAFVAKDAPLLVDDFHPAGDPRSRSEMSRLAQELARAWGDHISRDRMNADLTARPSQPPRGLGIMTGEDLPKVDESGLARYYLVDMRPNDVRRERLDSAQANARNGLLAGAMRGYIEWLAPQVEALPEALAQLFARYRAEASTEGEAHPRLASATAHLLTGYTFMLRYHVAHDLLAPEEARAMLEQGGRAIYENIFRQRETMRAENPVTLFLEALENLEASGALTFVPVERKEIDPNYREYALGGYTDSTHYYLLPGNVYAAVQELFRKQGGMFPISKNKLWQRLEEQGLAEKGTTRRFGGKVQHVIPLLKDAIEAHKALEGGMKQ